ncbi:MULTISPECIES: hypothetical protein [Paenibacillus]|uniref:hypothetical protein n=1 Tax=Paenibacillus TaxID=44249 RepID=UPI0001E6D66E|nr:MULTISPECIES: hypothetical protein [Paenibacillus]MCV9950079.1 hypothetical protein [Paenibacillus sp. BT-177]KAF6587070.1 hypothetical protein G9G57_01260 [Paenibacillus sp. EKM211P]MBU9706182.1 hypothetical protein [Paenibacillus sp. AK121]MDU8698487.1 hypothetical protein [Paenibacillus polymyxa]MEE4567623.1 hypothetical protein [Paenibacillus polymyxa]
MFSEEEAGGNSFHALERPYDEIPSVQMASEVPQYVLKAIFLQLEYRARLVK